MSKFALPCIKCGKPLGNTDEGVDNQPSGGLEFETPGHYGSTIHDFDFEHPDDPELLIVNICDTCVLRAIDAGIIQGRTNKIALSRHPVSEQERAWVLAQNEKHYGSAWGDDEPVDYREQMLKAGWPEDKIEEVPYGNPPDEKD